LNRPVDTAAANIQEVAPAEFAARWGVPPSIALLDVREGWEVDTAQVAGSIHMPMSKVPSRLAELDPNAPMVVMCHGGMRSLQVAQYLADQGFADIYNLSGGIDAWSQEVDPSVPRY
jgi:rhodanese-related sulfurtransferase